MVLVGKGEVDLLYLGKLFEYRPAHAVQGILHRRTVVVGEGLEDPLAYPAPQAVEVQARGVTVRPACGDHGSQDPVIGLGECGVAFPEKALEAGVGGLEHQEVVDPRLHPRAARIAPYDRGSFAGAPDKRVLVPPAGHPDAVPGVLDDAHPGALHGGSGVEEVVDQHRPERLDAARQVVLRQRVYGIAHGVRREQAGVVAPEVGGLEAALEGDVHTQIPEPVVPPFALHLDEPDLRLTVVILTQDDLFSGPSLARYLRLPRIRSTLPSARRRSSESPLARSLPLVPWCSPAGPRPARGWSLWCAP